MRYLLVLAFVLPLAAQTIIVADDEALLLKFRRWQPFLAEIGDTTWPPANDTAIADAGSALGTEEARKTARHADWRPTWGLLTNPQKRDLGYNAFESWAKPCKSVLTPKVQVAMNAADPITYPDPGAITNPQIRAWVRDQFNLWDLSDTAASWSHDQGCGGGSLHLGTPNVGNSPTLFAGGCVLSRCAAWAHSFSEIQLHWIQAMVDEEALTARFQFLPALPADWTSGE